LQNVPSGVVLASSWLSRIGYSTELIRNYKKSHWLESIGKGAMIRYGDEIDYLGAVYTMQRQLNMSIHPSAKTALSLVGRAHFIEMGSSKIYLFAGRKEVIPIWFRNFNWNSPIAFITTSFLPADLGLVTIEHKNFEVKISSATRAIMECLYMVPDKISLLECYQIMEGLTDLSPWQVQELLESCTSIKVKRLFLYLAEKSSHNWFKALNLVSIDLGTGKRSFVSSGRYIPKYQITVPVELEENEYPEI
jgi:hypothetical protein